MKGSSNPLMHIDKIEALQKDMKTINEKLDRLLIDKDNRDRRSEQ